MITCYVIHVSSSYGWGFFSLMKKLNYVLQLVYNVCVIGANMLACQSLCLSKQITYIFKILIDYISMFQRFPLLCYPFILFLLDFEVYYSSNFNYSPNKHKDNHIVNISNKPAKNQTVNNCSARKMDVNNKYLYIKKYN
jgi:hypothetical protein